MSKTPSPAYDKIDSCLQEGYFIVKIHVIQEGDTLWNLSQKYGVDFETLKEVNSHLEDPDNLMPGMKVKVPTVPAKAKKVAPKPAQEQIEPLPSKVEPKPEKPEVKPEPKIKVKPEVKPKDMPKIEVNITYIKQVLKQLSTHDLKKIIYEEKPELIQEMKHDIQQQMPEPLPKPPVPKPAHHKKYHKTHMYPSCPPFHPYPTQGPHPYAGKHSPCCDTHPTYPTRQQYYPPMYRAIPQPMPYTGSMPVYSPYVGWQSDPKNDVSMNELDEQNGKGQ